MWFNLFDNSSPVTSGQSTLFGWLLPPYDNTGYFGVECKEIMLGVASTIMMLPFELAIGVLESGLRSALNMPWGTRTLLRDNADFERVAMICIIGPVILLIPVIEQATNGIMKLSPTVTSSISLVSSSLIFSSLHDYGPKSTRFLTGVLYGTLSDKTNDLYAPTVAHITHNSLIVGIAMCLK
jgi:hypothetical protein